MCLKMLELHFTNDISWDFFGTQKEKKKIHEKSKFLKITF